MYIYDTITDTFVEFYYWDLNKPIVSREYANLILNVQIDYEIGWNIHTSV